MTVRLIFVLLFFFTSIFAKHGACEDLPANAARVDLVADVGEIVAPRIVPYVGAIERMNWVSPHETMRTLTVAAPIWDFCDTQFEIRFSVSEATRVQVDLMGPWVPDENGKLQRRMVHWKSVEVDGAALNGFRAGEAWHDGRIVTAFEAKPGSEIVLKCVATIPERLRDSTSHRPAKDSPAFELAEQFRRGINLANFLEVPPGEDWGDNTIRAEDFQQIAAEGFDHVRIPAGWHHYCGPGPDYLIAESFASRVDRLLDLAGQNGLAAIVNVHHFDQFTDAPDSQRDKLLRIWQQIAERYRDRPGSVAFEILNEPKDKATTEVMNGVYAELIPLIRHSNPDRAVFVGPGGVNRSPELTLLRLPSDDRLIVTVHTYSPHFFTHQGASWGGDVKDLRGIVFPGPPLEPVNIPNSLPEYLRRQIEQYNMLPAESNPAAESGVVWELKLAAEWGNYWNRPIHLGEFGVLTTADDESRARYLRLVRTESERLVIGWCLWDWKASMVYWDRAKQQAMPGLNDALFQH